MQMYAQTKKFVLAVNNRCNIVFIAVLLIGLYILNEVFAYVHVQTYEWQCTTLADYITPVKRHTCEIPEIGSSSVKKESTKKKPKIAMLQMYDNADGNWPKELMDRILANRNAYADQYGYTVINANDLIDHTRPAAWSKLKAVKTHLDTNKYDYILYIDMDVVIMNPTIPLEAFIVDGTDLTMTSDWNGLNSGVWMAKNTDWSKWFLQTCWDQTQLVFHPPGVSYPFEYEQRAFHFMTNSRVWQNAHLPHYRGDTEEIKSHIFYLPQCAMNAYVMHPFDYRGDREVSQYVEGDFLVHFAGKRGQMKTDLIDHYLKIVEK